MSGALVRIVNPVVGLREPELRIEPSDRLGILVGGPSRDTAPAIGPEAGLRKHLKSSQSASSESVSSNVDTNDVPTTNEMRCRKCPDGHRRHR